MKPRRNLFKNTKHQGTFLEDSLKLLLKLDIWVINLSSYLVLALTLLRFSGCLVLLR